MTQGWRGVLVSRIADSEALGSSEDHRLHQSIRYSAVMSLCPCTEAPMDNWTVGQCDRWIVGQGIRTEDDNWGRRLRKWTRRNCELWTEMRMEITKSPPAFTALTLSHVPCTVHQYTGDCTVHHYTTLSCSYDFNEYVRRRCSQLQERYALLRMSAEAPPPAASVKDLFASPLSRFV